MIHRRSGKLALGCGAALALVFAGCTQAPSPRSLPDGSALPSIAVALATATPAPSKTEPASPLVLPNPGGTCTASQLAVGKATMVGAPAAIMTMHVVIDEPVRNVGPDCVLALPGTIGLAPATGPFTAMTVANLGVDVCKNGTCHYTYPTSFAIHAKQSFTVVLNAWWWFDPSAPTPAPCEGRLREVSRAIFPVADGVIAIGWDGVVEEVCSDPQTISVGIELT